MPTSTVRCEPNLISACFHLVNERNSQSLSYLMNYGLILHRPHPSRAEWARFQCGATMWAISTFPQCHQDNHSSAIMLLEQVFEVIAALWTVISGTCFSLTYCAFCRVLNTPARLSSHNNHHPVLIDSFYPVSQFEPPRLPTLVFCSAICTHWKSKPCLPIHHFMSCSSLCCFLFLAADRTV